jgi:hypothetical protein
MEGSREGSAEDDEVDDSEVAGEGDLDGVNNRSGSFLRRFKGLVNNCFLRDILNEDQFTDS